MLDSPLLSVCLLWSVPSVLWHLVGRQEGHLVKNWVVRCWRGYLSGARCRLAYAQLMPLPLTVSSKIQIGFTFLVTAHPGSPGKRAVKRVCVCVSSFVYLLVWDPLLHTRYISSPNHYLFATHARTMAACFAVLPMLCHLFLTSVSAT